MRTNFPPTGAAPTPRDSLKRALLLSFLLVIVWSAVALMPDPVPPDAVPTADRIETEAAASTETQDGSAEASSSALLEADDQRSLLRPGYFLVILFLAGGALFALWLKRRGTPGGPAHGLTTMGRLSLGPQQQIQLVRCAGEVLLVGTSPSGVTLLKTYDVEEFPVAEPTATPAGLLARAFQAPAPREAATVEPVDEEGPEAEDTPVDGTEFPEWTVATASAISGGPDFMHVLRRYAGRKTYKANNLYPPAGASN